MERGFYEKDASYDGIFYVGVRTTGIFCRPSCSARPKLENVEFFRTIREAVFAGYRPCKRCAPTQLAGIPPGWVARLIKKSEAEPKRKISAGELRMMGITPERARHWFLGNYGMTFVEWQRGRRLAGAFTQIRDGAPLDDVVFANGYHSHSGFRDAISRTFGLAPGKLKSSDFITAQFIETPLGPMLAAATNEGVCFLEFSDRRMLEYNYMQIKKRFKMAVLPTTNGPLEELRGQLHSYFRKGLRKFTVPLVSRGTAFQERVWRELLAIPYGETISYQELARRIGDVKLVRAVARANGMNRIAILIPCHRVVGKDGELTGYGGGLWRKRLLLELERTGRLPGDKDN
jgi:AraC family transcriptional regulator, regulatory protein of adaptative response / methylated-DNA-[protein]-cysteine methyltransferase